MVAGKSRKNPVSSSIIMTPEELHQAEFLLGPWLVGCYFDAFLQGILCCQVNNYFRHYPEDKKRLKIAVAGLAFLTTLKTVHCFALIWIQQIRHFTDLQGAIDLNYVAWWQTGNPLFASLDFSLLQLQANIYIQVAIIGFFVQIYYCHRLYIISNRYAVVLPIFSIFVFSLIAICLAASGIADIIFILLLTPVPQTYYIGQRQDKNIALWFAVHLSTVCASDVLMAATTAAFLLRSKKNVLPQTSGLITALVRLTFQTATPAAICALLNLIFSQIYNGNEKIISTAFNTLMPKLYAISMMWTLNSRRRIRDAHSSHDGFYTSSGIQVHHSSAMARNRGQTWRTTDADLEMGPMETSIQITRTTVRRVDHLSSLSDDKQPPGLEDGCSDIPSQPPTPTKATPPETPTL
ncbi:hypothetical protein VKT23_015671 [Stygiomarasmius scandens]|uniref:DUF6534 domain-containing protein n=1 Tax=Marasmiellus scandens TaxID=2682957 RepID=A0ABR1IX43_9AGAR